MLEKLNNGLKSGVIILLISIAGIVIFNALGRPVPVFFTRFLVMGVLITIAGLFVLLRDVNNDKDDEGRRL
ncbi:MAG: hypothetical protein J6H21_06170 [Firmicutes bacterium]|nr:hypothetical protein [Bacillota bacterium]